MSPNKFMKSVYFLLIQEGKLEENIATKLCDSTFISALEEEIDAELDKLTSLELDRGLDDLNKGLDLNYKRTLSIHRTNKKDPRRRRSKDSHKKPLVKNKVRNLNNHMNKISSR